MTFSVQKRYNGTTVRSVIRIVHIFRTEYQYNRSKQTSRADLFRIDTVVLSIAGGEHTNHPFFILL